MVMVSQLHSWVLPSSIAAVFLRRVFHEAVVKGERQLEKHALVSEAASCALYYEVLRSTKLHRGCIACLEVFCSATQVSQLSGVLLQIATLITIDGRGLRSVCDMRIVTLTTRQAENLATLQGKKKKKDPNS